MSDDHESEQAMASLVLPPDLAHVRLARSFATDQCRSADLDEDALETTVLLVSELVTNALLHASSQARLRMRVQPSLVYAEIGDDAESLPRMRPAAREDLGGRGLNIVDMLADAWGVRAVPEGKVVWFELHSAADAPAQSRLCEPAFFRTAASPRCS